MSQRSLFLVLGLLVALIGLTALRIGLPELFGVDEVSADYIIFHQVGELANLGRIAETYDAAAFKAYQASRTNSAVFMTWTYPPHFNLPLQGLALFGVGWGYLLFTGSSFALFVWSMMRLSQDATIWVLPLILPALVINLLTGQNGFLTAGLMALFAGLSLTEQGGKAGFVLGLLTYKPHLGLGLGLAALLRGGWRMVAMAMLTLLVLLLLATYLYGSDIWNTFRNSVSTSGTILEAGEYKLARMITPFALLSSIGLAPSLAILLHGGCALFSLLTLACPALKGWQLRHIIVLAILSGTTLSPYAYDYDLCVLAPALALAYQAIKTELTITLRAALAASLLLATGYGLTTALFAGALGDAGFGLPALAGLGLILTIGLTFHAIRRFEANA
ncbi:MAG: glycosyltransferase family 87 protein [Lentibacter sp.]|uniref:glycosyltransferase family 87 protein n=1 Tax=Lentibacter sp. TaxID=2024994 RepID=UPI002622FB66|nr:glycosyltransferase family 87 protein [Lentibacter sp.]MDG1289502.1 glycosyltransferase family 87 protein [Lentibacter sp.]